MAWIGLDTNACRATNVRERETERERGREGGEREGEREKERGERKKY